MAFPRSSGILLHPTSLPGGHGIGDLGREAYRFVDWLVSAGQSFWQVLPLNPTGYGDSPYQGFSACAGNHLLISLDALADLGIIPGTSLPQGGKGAHIDYGMVVTSKTDLLRRAFKGFREKAPSSMKDRFGSFCGSMRNKWLEDYALFRALKDHFGGKPWPQWDAELVRRDPATIEKWSRQLAEDVLFHKWLQFEFFRQWSELRAYAGQNGIQIIGDAPIFVAHDSADVWSNQGMFRLDGNGNCTHVAGVPPDYFSATGQLWGNPLYNWDAMAGDGFRWWVERFRVLLTCVDYVRLDHFRGFEAFWEIPGGEPTAVNGRWVKAPGAALLKALAKGLGRLPIIAEDLGVLTPEVEALRDGANLPGMRILQFGFEEGPQSIHLPHNYTRNTVVYPGSHDNDTLMGWYRTADDRVKMLLAKYVGEPAEPMPWSVLRLALSSVADLAVIPAQDLLALDTPARMNFPGKASGNWAWRLKPGTLLNELAKRLLDMNRSYGRA